MCITYGLNGFAFELIAYFLQRLVVAIKSLVDQFVRKLIHRLTLNDSFTNCATPFALSRCVSISFGSENSGHPAFKLIP